MCPCTVPGITSVVAMGLPLPASIPAASTLAVAFNDRSLASVWAGSSFSVRSSGLMRFFVQAGEVACTCCCRCTTPSHKMGTCYKGGYNRILVHFIYVLRESYCIDKVVTEGAVMVVSWVHTFSLAF